MLVSSLRPSLRPPRCLRLRSRALSSSHSKPSSVHKPQRSTVSSPPPQQPFTPSQLSFHWDTIAPTPSQVKHAASFFTRAPPRFLWSAEKFKTMDFGGSPEVCFLGRSNVGKSSLLNALLKKEIAHASARRGRTRLMNAFAVGGIGGPEEVPSGTEEKGLVVMDMPGYGHGAHAEWGKEIMKYLDKRKQLKRAFVLIDAEHEFKASDQKTIRMLQELQVPFQVVLSKVDRILFGKNGKKFPSGELLQKKLGRVHQTALKAKELVMPSAEDEGRGIGEVIAVCSQNPVDGKPIGIDQLRFAVLRAAGLELEQKSTGSRVVIDETVPYEGDGVHMPALRKAEKVIDEDIVPFEEIPELFTPESGESEQVEQRGRSPKD